MKNTLQVEDHKKQFWFGRSLNLETAQIEFGTNFKP